MLFQIPQFRALASQKSRCNRSLSVAIMATRTGLLTLTSPRLPTLFYFEAPLFIFRKHFFLFSPISIPAFFGIQSLHLIAAMGTQPPFLYEDVRSSKTFDPRAVSRASLQPKPLRPKQDGPLISFNAHPE